jgi:hypothetical protein
MFFIGPKLFQNDWLSVVDFQVLYDTLVHRLCLASGVRRKGKQRFHAGHFWVGRTVSNLSFLMFKLFVDFSQPRCKQYFYCSIIHEYFSILIGFCSNFKNPNISEFWPFYFNFFIKYIFSNDIFLKNLLSDLIDINDVLHFHEYFSLKPLSHLRRFAAIPRRSQELREIAVQNAMFL